MSESIIKILMWNYQWLIALKIYKNFLSRDREYGGSMELICISHLFSNYLFRVYCENNANTMFYVMYCVCITHFVKNEKLLGKKVRTILFSLGQILILLWFMLLNIYLTVRFWRVPTRLKWRCKRVFITFLHLLS